MPAPSSKAPDTAILRAHPVLAGRAPGVEALRVRRTRGRAESFVVPIADGYELVGLIRRHWQGFAGGDDAGRPEAMAAGPS